MKMEQEEFDLTKAIFGKLPFQRNSNTVANFFIVFTKQHIFYCFKNKRVYYYHLKTTYENTVSRNLITFEIRVLVNLIPNGQCGKIVLSEKPSIMIVNCFLFSYSVY